MEKIQLSTEIEQKLQTLFKKRRLFGVALIIVGIIGLLPIGISYAVGSMTTYYSSPVFIFFVFGILLWSQSEDAAKKIKKNDCQVFKAKCKGKKLFEYVLVDNNEILSKKVKRPLKYIEFLGPRESKIDDEIGILQTGKTFWAFSL